MITYPVPTMPRSTTHLERVARLHEPGANEPLPVERRRSIVERVRHIVRMLRTEEAP